MRPDPMNNDSAHWAGSDWPRCTGACDQGRKACVCQTAGGASIDTRQPMPAEACTELGCESRARMGKLTPMERFLFRHKSGAETIFWVIVILAAFGLAGNLDWKAGL